MGDVAHRFAQLLPLLSDFAEVYLVAEVLLLQLCPIQPEPLLHFFEHGGADGLQIFSKVVK